MEPLRIAGRRADTGARATVLVSGRTIADIVPGVATNALGGPDLWLAPGFVDLQVNGYAGADFNLAAWGDADEVRFDPRAVVERLARSGTTRLCPTVTTNALDAMADALDRLAEAAASDPELEDALIGFHVEGPWISPDDGPRGAHPKEHVRTPRWDDFLRLQDAARGRVRIVTLAPELPGALPIVERLAAAGIVVALGHTAADPQTIRDAVSAGATLSTHLGNGAHATLPRHPNLLWEQLADDRLVASVIPDGHHLPAATLQTFVRAKTPERIALVSDAVSLGGLPPGTYARGRYAVEPSGRVVTAGTPYLAGAGFLLDTGVAFAAARTDLELSGAVRCATAVPAHLLGLAPRVGTLAAGSDADLVLFAEPAPDRPLEIVLTMRAGRIVHFPGAPA